MKSFRYLFFLLLGGLMSGCSSDNELINGSESNFIESDVEWVSAKLADVYVVEGDNSSDLTTRSADEVDPNTKNPKSALPDGIDIYIAFYQDGELQKDAIKLDTENGYSFNYKITPSATDGDIVTFESVVDDKKVSLPLSSFPKSLFIFTSFDPKDGTEFSLKKLEVGENLYDTDKNQLFPDAYEEYHDRLFSSDGMIFEKEGDGYVVKSVGANASMAYPVKEWDVELNRMTACITLSTMIIEGVDDNGHPKSIGDIDEFTSLDKAIEATDMSLHAAGYPETMSVTNIFTRKKGLENFPLSYDFIDGVQAGLGAPRGNVYLCNLDNPAWMDELASYQWGDKKQTMYGISSQCDNYPFFPVTEFNDVRNINLLLFMGFRDKTSTSTKQTVLAYRVPINSLTLQYNRNHYLYLALTVQNIVDMYKKFLEEDAKYPKTRGVDEPIIIDIPSEQLIMRSEPYFSNK